MTNESMRTFYVNKNYVCLSVCLALFSFDLFLILVINKSQVKRVFLIIQIVLEMQIFDKTYYLSYQI